MSDSRGPRHRMHPLLRLAGHEALTILGLLTALLLLTGLMQQTGLNGAGQPPGGIFEFLTSVHRGRNGQLLWPQFLEISRTTLPLVGAACLWLCLLSIGSGILLAAVPRMQSLRWIILALSGVPSFLWPLVRFLFSDHPFEGFAGLAIWGWPALCLAVGDLNWLTGATVVQEAARQEMSRPHWRLARALRSPVLFDLGPRVLVSLLSLLAARLPHLLGGTIVLETLFRLNGLGLWTWNAIIETPPEPAVLVWAGGLSILLSRLLHLIAAITATVCLPHEAVAADEASFDETVEREEQVLKSASPSRSGGTGGEFTLVVPVQTVDERAATVPARPDRRESLRARWRYFLRVSPASAPKAMLALLMTCGWIVLLGLLLGHGLIEHAERPPRIMEPPSLTHPFGTNAAADDVAGLLRRGFRQQLSVWGLVVLLQLLAVPLAVCGVLESLSHHAAGQWFARGLRFIADGLTALIEATPRLVWLLACCAIFTLDGMVYKLAAAMGVLFLPQLYRALREDLAPVRHSLFLEALQTAGISWPRILWRNVLVTHVWPVLCVQLPLILSNVVLMEAWLGYLGIRNRSEIFTWGSVLGTGVDEFVQMRPNAAFGLPFNDGVVGGPLLMAWLTICVSTSAGHALKILTGSYVWRLR